MEFSQNWFDYLRILDAIFAMFTIRGWAFINIWEYWTRCETIQCRIIAIGLNIHFYPFMLISNPSIFPGFQIGRITYISILFLGLLWLALKVPRKWKLQFRFDSLERLSITIIFCTLFTRLCNAYAQPSPCLIRLPTSPKMSHLGLYSTRGTVLRITDLPAHTGSVVVGGIINKWTLLASNINNSGKFHKR